MNVHLVWTFANHVCVHHNAWLSELVDAVRRFMMLTGLLTF
jgi:hypothetical protein